MLLFIVAAALYGKQIELVVRLHVNIDFVWELYIWMLEITNLNHSAFATLEF
jgi:hypothetical protein